MKMPIVILLSIYIIYIYVCLRNCHTGGIHFLFTLATHVVTQSPHLAAAVGASLSTVVLVIGISAVFFAVLVIVCVNK